jgi:hypothetical protein
MDKQLIDEIMYVAFRINQAQYTALTTTDRNKKETCERFAKRWNIKLNDKRKNATFYGKASSLSNLQILGLNYIENQFKTTKDFEAFKANILNIRRNKVKTMFFGKFGKKNIFDDSYIYEGDGMGSYKIDSLTLTENFDKSSIFLKYCDANKPLIGGWDPGSFMSFVIAQKKPQAKELRLIKNFWVIHPAQHSEMATKFNEFFKFHRKKTLQLYYDRAGNKSRKEKTTNGDVGDTDAKLFKRELEKLGWEVTLMSLGKRVIEYWEHYNLLNILFDEKNGLNTDKIKLCQNECEELISSIYMSPLKKTEGKIELDKSSEKELDFEDQALYSTQLSSALMYLLFGEYERYLPTSKREVKDYSNFTA